MDAENAKVPNSIVEAEGGSGHTKQPSFGYLVISLGAMGVFCAYLRYPKSDFAIFAPILLGFFSFYSVFQSPEAHRPLKRRDYFWIFGFMAGLALLGLLIGKREFPAFEAFVAQPVFVVPLWLLLSGLTICLWCVRRRRFRDQHQGHGTA